MDPEAGRFIDGDMAPSWMPRFEVGEVIKVKGEEFEVEGIEERRLILKPMNFEERRQREMRGFVRELGDSFPEHFDPNRHERRRAEKLSRRG